MNGRLTSAGFTGLFVSDILPPGIQLMTKTLLTWPNVGKIPIDGSLLRSASRGEECLRIHQVFRCALPLPDTRMAGSGGGFAAGGPPENGAEGGRCAP
ncbi:hypothetical protein GCM10009738_49730 [Kitasatospora viridis]